MQNKNLQVIFLIVLTILTLNVFILTFYKLGPEPVIIQKATEVKIPMPSTETTQTDKLVTYYQIQPSSRITIIRNNEATAYNIDPTTITHNMIKGTIEFALKSGSYINSYLILQDSLDEETIPTDIVINGTKTTVDLRMYPAAESNKLEIRGEATLTGDLFDGVVDDEVLFGFVVVGVEE